MRVLYQKYAAAWQNFCHKIFAMDNVFSADAALRAPTGATTKRCRLAGRRSAA